MLEPENGRVIVVHEENKDTDTAEHWVEFKMWDYATMTRLRKESMKYHYESRTFYVDQDMFDEVKIRNLMSSWSFGEIDEKAKLVHFNGLLVDESMNMIKNFYPSLVVVIIREMNTVLEGNR